ncbi:protein of unknown function [Pseudorhizobium banfieldiae]|uniref:UvrD-like helicase C-terminal domain-containing protein n=1 Tax=Pseudorhizobium banfieldiae TaxID=1125847 RepID=L0ND71_9HYPH|nr:protein of unknown function [Pseudorhizobium banfieldiae]
MVNRERFLTELTLDPPDATSDQAGVPLLDEDYLILSTIHSGKGQEWRSVFMLNCVDGCIPSDLATGTTAEIEEERRLLYVGMTRARDSLTLITPQRLFTGGQNSQGDRHVYASRTRFIPATLLQFFETATWPQVSTAAGERSARQVRCPDALDVEVMAGAERPALTPRNTAGVGNSSQRRRSNVVELTISTPQMSRLLPILELSPTRLADWRRISPVIRTHASTGKEHPQARRSRATPQNGRAGRARSGLCISLYHPMRCPEGFSVASRPSLLLTGTPQLPRDPAQRRAA